MSRELYPNDLIDKTIEDVSAEPQYGTYKSGSVTFKFTDGSYATLGAVNMLIHGWPYPVLGGSYNEKD